MPGRERTQGDISFRTVLLVSVLAVLLATTGVVGVFYYLNARFIVGDLSDHVLDQTTARIHDRIRGLLNRAALVSDLHTRGLSERRLTADDLPEILIGFHDSMIAATELTYLSLGLEDGCYGHVRRYPNGRLEATIDVPRADGRAVRRDFDVVDRSLEERRAVVEDYDPRTRPWYEWARSARRQTWPAVYLFKNVPNPDYPGLTCATPVKGPDGRLQGVMTADFDLISLGAFLADLRIFDRGVAFVVEIGTDGSRRVIAHPDPEAIVGEVVEDGTTRTDILPLASIGAAPIRALVGREGAETAGTMTYEADGTEYIGALLPLESRHDLNWLIGITVPAGDLMAPVDRSNVQTLVIGLVSLLLASVLVIYLSRRISRPLQRLVEQTQAIGEFRLEPGGEQPTRLAELCRVNTALEEMKTGLRSFQKYVPAELVRTVLATGREAVLGGERRELTVLFSDLAGFTPAGEALEPETLVEVLGDYLECISAEIAEAGGTVDKFIGDAVMAFWGAPMPMVSHALDACRAALGCQEGLRRLRDELERRGLPALRLRIGVSTGELVVGNIGSSSRFNYTVIGDPVNLASRLEGLNKFYGTSIMIGQATYEAARDGIVARPVERVSVKGRTQGTLVYELLALREYATPADRRRVARTEEALARYHARDFAGARAIYAALASEDPDDGAARAMVQRCEAWECDPPPEGWDRVRQMERK